MVGQASRKDLEINSRVGDVGMETRSGFCISVVAQFVIQSEVVTRLFRNQLGYIRDFWNSGIHRILSILGQMYNCNRCVLANCK